jgi:AraC-like DNA-binding protein
MSITFYDDLVLLHGGTGGHPSEPVVLRGRDYYCLQYNHAGTIEVRIDNALPRSVHGPSVLVTSPGHDFIFGNHEGWHHSHIAFSGPRVARYIESGLLPTEQPIVQIHDSGEFLKMFEHCVRALRSGDEPTSCHLLEGLLLRLHAPSDELAPMPHHEEVRQLAEAMREAPTEEYDLEREAAWIHISEAHLRRLFRKLVGSSPSRFLLQCRLTASADRLATTRDPIKQIAADYQFQSIHHFTRVFSKQYGLPPGRFRRELLGDVVRLAGGEAERGR